MPRQQYQVWHRDSATVLHALRVTADSLSGVPYVQPPSCDTCRLAFPLTAIDSLHAGDLETAGFTIAGLPIFALVLLAVGMATSSGSD